jgi:prefoldin subunit 5
VDGSQPLPISAISLEVQQRLEKYERQVAYLMTQMQQVEQTVSTVDKKTSLLETVEQSIRSKVDN